MDNGNVYKMASVISSVLWDILVLSDPSFKVVKIVC